MDANIPDPDPGHQDEIGPDLTALERRLAAWRPAAGVLDRERMLYDAGRASVGIRPWRLATAALLLVSLGSSGLLLHQRSLLARERALLAAERSHRLGLETALAARIEASRPPSQIAVTAQASSIEPPAPSSYLVLTARLAEGTADVASSDVDGDSERRKPAPGPAEGQPRPGPLRPRDVRRVIEL
jgi:hypothetical protein